MKTSILDNWIHQKHFPAEAWSREVLEAWQLQKIRQLILNVREKSPFYRKLYQGLSLPKSLEDFQQYPLIDAKNLKTEGLKMLSVSQRDISRVVTLETSGTTEKPKRIYFTEEDQELTIDFFANGMGEVTASGEKTAVFLPWKTSGCVGDLLIRGLCRSGMHGIGIGILKELPEVTELLRKEEVTSAVGTPVQILGLMEYAKENGIELPLRTVLTSTDLLSESVRRRLENFSLEVFDHLGMTECGLGVALECKAHRGMHIRENDLFIEVVDEQGKPLPDGMYGELAVTTLTRAGMILLRYRTGDRGRILPGTCPCGSLLRRIEVTGRKAEARFFGKSIRELDNLLFGFEKVVDYRIEEQKEGYYLELDCFQELSAAELNRIRAELMQSADDSESSEQKRFLDISCRTWKDRLPDYRGKRKIHC